MMCLQSACSALGALASLSMQRALARGQYSLGNISASRMVACFLAYATSTLSLFLPAQKSCHPAWCWFLRDVLGATFAQEELIWVLVLC